MRLCMHMTVAKLHPTQMLVAVNETYSRVTDKWPHKVPHDRLWYDSQNAVRQLSGFDPQASAPG